MNTNTGKTRGFGSNKGRQRGTPNKLTQWERRTLAKNVLLALTPLELKYMLMMETEKFIQLCRVPVVRRAIELHGVNLKVFIREHSESHENLNQFSHALQRVVISPKGKRYRRTGRWK